MTSSNCGVRGVRGVVSRERREIAGVCDDVTLVGGGQTRLSGLITLIRGPIALVGCLITLIGGALPCIGAVQARIGAQITLIGGVLALVGARLGGLLALIGGVVALVGGLVTLVGGVLALVGARLGGLLALIGGVVALVGCLVALVGGLVALVGGLLPHVPAQRVRMRVTRARRIAVAGGLVDGGLATTGGVSRALSHALAYSVSLRTRSPVVGRVCVSRRTASCTFAGRWPGGRARGHRSMARSGSTYLSSAL